MKETTAAAEKLIPPTLNKNAVSKNKGPEQATCQEVRTPVVPVYVLKISFLLAAKADSLSLFISINIEKITVH